MGRVALCAGLCLLMAAGARVSGSQLPSTYVPPDLVAVAGGYSPERSYFLRRETATAYETLRAAARRGGVALWIVSGFRSFERQKQLHQNQVLLDGPGQTTVAQPGFSEHQLGMAIDFCGADPKAVTNARFAETVAGRWLREHAPDHGFSLSYTAANQPTTGFSDEPWHYRYVGLAGARLRHESALRGTR
jgi:D-alanyl-D-alanine carboxypeptidase